MNDAQRRHEKNKGRTDASSDDRKTVAIQDGDTLRWFATSEAEVWHSPVAALGRLYHIGTEWAHHEELSRVQGNPAKLIDATVAVRWFALSGLPMPDALAATDYAKTTRLRGTMSGRAAKLDDRPAGWDRATDGVRGPV